jgi:hypothetical protein
MELYLDVLMHKMIRETERFLRAGSPHATWNRL